MLRPEEREVLARIHGPLLAVGDDGLISHVSKTALLALGWDASLIGKPLRSIIPGGRRETHRENYHVVSLGAWPKGGFPSPRAFLDQEGRERQLHSQVALFSRPDGSKFLCATVTEDARHAGLAEITAALRAVGYTKLSPES